MSSTKCFRLNLAWGLDVSVVSTYTAVIRMWSQKPAQLLSDFIFADTSCSGLMISKSSEASTPCLTNCKDARGWD